MKTKARIVLDYWKSSSQNGQIPSKDAINPISLKALLPNVFILERVAEEKMNVRLCGTYICDAYHKNLTNENMLDVYLPEHRILFNDFFEKLFMIPAVGVSMRHIKNEFDRRVGLKSLYLPCLDADGIPRFLLGVTETSQNIKLRNDSTVLNLPKIGTPRLKYFDINFDQTAAI
jgi:hypothetical protein